MSEEQFHDGLTKNIDVPFLDRKFVKAASSHSDMHSYGDSICYYFFSKQIFMNDFLRKYRDFKIYDDKGRVYPLHIARALYQGCGDMNILEKKHESVEADEKEDV